MLPRLATTKLLHSTSSLMPSSSALLLPASSQLPTRPLLISHCNSRKPCGIKPILNKTLHPTGGTPLDLQVSMLLRSSTLTHVKSTSCAIALSNYNEIKILCKNIGGWWGCFTLRKRSDVQTFRRSDDLNPLESHPCAITSAKSHGMISLRNNRGWGVPLQRKGQRGAGGF
jgi:hypothetical protein